MLIGRRKPGGGFAPELARPDDAPLSPVSSVAMAANPMQTPGGPQLSAAGKVEMASKARRPVFGAPMSADSAPTMTPGFDPASVAGPESWQAEAPSLQAPIDPSRLKVRGPGFNEPGGWGEKLQMLAAAFMNAGGNPMGAQAIYQRMGAEQRQRFEQQQQQDLWSRQDAQRAEDRRWQVEDRDAKLSAPQYFMSGRDRVSFDPVSGESSVIYDGPEDYQNYADTLGLEPGQDGYDTAVQDYVLRSAGPTAVAGKQSLEGTRQAHRVALRGMPTYRDSQKAGGNGIPAIARPRVLTDPGDGRLGATLRGFADPINVLDEAGAVVDSLLPGGERENVWGSDRRFGDIYSNNLEQNRSILDHDEKDYEWYRFGGQLASGLALPGASVEGVGLAAARSALRGGASRYAAEQAARRAFVGRLGAAGAVEGGLAGVGQGETAEERVVGGLIGAPAGGALAVGAGFAAPRIAQLVGRPFSRVRGRASEQTAESFADGAVDTAKAIGNNDALELRVPDLPDVGQSPARSLADLSPEERARLDMEMEKAQEPFIFDQSLDGPHGGDWRNETPEEKAARYAEIDARFEASRFDRRPAPEAMASEVDQPALYGPPFAEDTAWPGREADRIDVTQPSPMTASATNLERLAAANRFLSRDALPLPSNAVDGIEEAARIERGRYAPVRAGDEADELGTRVYPNTRTGTPISKKGPLDLVAWLRTQGGIREQGGELKHAGIDNAARKGVDFAGGEQRLGPLVSDRGMSYDEAAERAWEAGYFPDSADRPTIREFLDVLRETHAGRNRAFTPDDLAEVERFEGVRQNRWDVEQANDRGAPLTNDRAGPVNMADLDANAPPVRAYEEWGENAPNLAGNIRLDKLDSPQAIKRALVQTEQVAGGFDAARRARITQAETRNLAADLGMTADDLLKRRKGQAFNAEEALAARQILARSATDLVNLARGIARIDNPGDEAEAAFREAWLRHAAIQEQVSGMTAEAGRALQQFRQTADSRDTGRVLSSLGEMLGGPDRLKDIAGRIVDLEDAGTTAGGINRFALKALSPTWKDQAVELYINSLLSGPQTHVVNILSNTLTSLAQLPEHAAGAAVGVVRRALPGQAETDRVMFSEVGARAAGMIFGAKEGMRAAARAFLTGNSSDAASKVENELMKAIPGMAGSVIRTPTRLLSAEDELFKGVARRMELSGLAIRQAKAEGLTGKAARDRAGELMLDPPDDMLKRSFDYARYLTFQTPLEHGSAAAGLSRATQRRQELKLLLPFIRTPMNLLKFAAERSPAAPIMKSWRREYDAGGARRDMAVARMMLGTGIGAAMYEMAAAGQITGGGPSDPNLRRMMMANGWQPYSLKIGDTYYSYARLDPFSTTIGTAADLYELSDSLSDGEKEGSAMMLGAAILNNLSSKTWLSGLSSALEAVNDPDRYLSSFVARTAGAIAVPAIIAQTARATDPLMREARSPLDRIRSRVPGLSNDLYPRRDVFGREMRQQGGIGPDFVSPIWTSAARHHPTLNALVSAQAKITPPQRSYTEGGKRKEWTPAEYDRLQEVTGQLAEPRLAALVKAAEWARTPQEDQQESVRKTMTKVRKEAKAQVKRGVFGAPMRADGGPI